MMVVQRILIADTHISVLARPRDKKAVESLADSMNQLGLLNPITVIAATYTARGRADNPGFKVIAGGHRYEAAKMLGWSEIDAFVVDYAEDDTRQRMIEISENLHRAELTALERSKLVAEWADIVARNKPRQVDAVNGGRGNVGGNRDAARQLNLSEPEVRRSVKVASLTPEAQSAAIDAGLDDNRSALLEAAKRKTPEDQVRYIQERKEMKLAPPVMDAFEAREAWLAKGIKWFNSGAREWQYEFIDRVSAG